MATTCCYRHPDRAAGAMCRRCQRPVCPQCMVEAPVGWQCRSCVRGEDGGVTRVRYQRAAATPGRIRLTPVVAALIAVNVIVYLLTINRPDRVLRFDMWPAAVHAGQYYRLLTGAFLHASVLHIGFNMFALAIFGPLVEQDLGRVRFLTLYLLSALGGSVGSYLFNEPGVQGLGASGAIFGLLGAYFVICKFRRINASGVVWMIVVNLIISFSDPVIDWRAHVGGLIVGGLVTLAYLAEERWSLTARVAAQATTSLAALGVLDALVHLPPGRYHL